MGPLIVLARKPIKKLFFLKSIFHKIFKLDYTYNNKCITLHIIVLLDNVGIYKKTLLNLGVISSLWRNRGTVIQGAYFGAKIHI